MAHRMAFPANCGVPLAIKVSHAGGGRLLPRGADDEVLFVSSSVDIFAVDLALLDADVTDDVLRFVSHTYVGDGRRLEIRADRLIVGESCQHFGGVATNLFVPDGDRWTVQRLQAWGLFDVRVDGVLTDFDLLGSVVLTDRIGDPESEVSLSVSIYPIEVGPDGTRNPAAVRAFGETWPDGWAFVWDDVTYLQAPVLSIRAERGDSLARIAREMSVDLEMLIAANQKLAWPSTDRLPPGATVYVPLIVKARSAATRKVHPSRALSWKEIMHGWTTLN